MLFPKPVNIVSLKLLLKYEVLTLVGHHETVLVANLGRNRGL